MARQWFEAVAVMTCMLLSVPLLCCSRDDKRNAAVVSAVGAEVGRSDRVPDAARTAAPDAAPVNAAVAAERSISFAWRPAGSSPSAYAMSDPRDQHRILLTRGIERGKSYPVVVAMHGQPRRGHAPRSYVFARVVSEVTRESVETGTIDPLILVTPVFRFEGQNWPKFQLGAFMTEVRRILSEAEVGTSGTYVFGHSGAAGCGGEGLNFVASMAPSAVGFFDTCVGAGFVQAARELAKNKVPTLILHSVETAGFHPRQPVEYDADFDFGKVYATIGLRPSTCPSRLPGAALRPLAYRCAQNEGPTTLAMVLDTGRGEQAHEALVPVALRYFLQEYVQRHNPGDH